MSVFTLVVAGLTLVAMGLLMFMGLRARSFRGAERRRAALILLIVAVTLINLFFWLTGPEHEARLEEAVNAGSGSL